MSLSQNIITIYEKIQKIVKLSFNAHRENPILQLINLMSCVIIAMINVFHKLFQEFFSKEKRLSLDRVGSFLLYFSSFVPTTKGPAKKASLRNFPLLSDAGSSERRRLMDAHS